MEFMSSSLKRMPDIYSPFVLNKLMYYFPGMILVYIQPSDRDLIVIRQYVYIEFFILVFKLLTMGNFEHIHE